MITDLESPILAHQKCGPDTNTKEHVDPLNVISIPELAKSFVIFIKLEFSTRVISYSYCSLMSRSCLPIRIFICESIMDGKILLTNCET